MSTEKKDSIFPINLLLIQTWIFIVSMLISSYEIRNSESVMVIGSALSIACPYIYYLFRVLKNKRKNDWKYPIKLLLVQSCIIFIANFIRNYEFVNSKTVIVIGFTFSIALPYICYLVGMCADKKGTKNKKEVV